MIDKQQKQDNHIFQKCAIFHETWLSCFCLESDGEDWNAFVFNKVRTSHNGIVLISPN